MKPENIERLHKAYSDAHDDKQRIYIVAVNSGGEQTFKHEIFIRSIAVDPTYGRTQPRIDIGFIDRFDGSAWLEHPENSQVEFIAAGKL